MIGECYELGVEDRELHFFLVSFDGGYECWFTLLSYGACVVICDQ